MAEMLAIEIAYGDARRQQLHAFSVTAGSSLAQALETAAGLGLITSDYAQADVGIFGKKVKDPAQHLMAAGERIELYRPLSIDPKEIRRRRAARPD